MAERNRGGAVGVAELESVRRRLRTASVDARVGAVADLRSWHGAGLAEGASALSLRTAGGSFPWVPGVVDDPGELLVRLNEADPHAADPGEMGRAYLLGTESTRRAVLHLWALRADAVGVDALAHLLAPDGPLDLLPRPASDTLLPVLAAPEAARLGPALARVAWRRGWLRHSADLVGHMVRDDRLSTEALGEVTGHLVPMAIELVELCDRAVAADGGPDLTRGEVGSLASLTELFTLLVGPETDGALRRALASADPRVGVLAAAALLECGEDLAPERLGLLARDPEARALLFDRLMPGGAPALPQSCRDERALAEADLVRHLASPSELGTAPGDVEHRAVTPAPLSWGRGRLHVFAFRVRPPHWAASRGWMVAAVGPYGGGAGLPGVGVGAAAGGAAVPVRAEGHAAHTLYEVELSGELDSHVLAIADSLTAQRSSGGAAA